MGGIMKKETATGKDKTLEEVMAEIEKQLHLR